MEQEKLEGTVIKYSYEQDGEIIEFKLQIVDKDVKEAWVKDNKGEWICLHYTFLKKTQNAALSFTKSLRD